MDLAYYKAELITRRQEYNKDRNSLNKWADMHRAWRKVKELEMIAFNKRSRK